VLLDELGRADTATLAKLLGSLSGRELRFALSREALVSWGWLTRGRAGATRPMTLRPHFD
jgi:hypothetical protein